MSFKKQNVGYFLESLKVFVLWLVVYTPLVLIYFALGWLLSDFYATPMIGFEDFEWLEWYNRIFIIITVVSAVYHAVWILFIVPFSNVNTKTKKRQFIVGFVLSCVIVVMFVGLVLGFVLGLETQGLVLYSCLCIIYFPVLFIVSRFCVPGMYRYCYWFKGGKSKVQN